MTRMARMTDACDCAVGRAVPLVAPLAVSRCRGGVAMVVQKHAPLLHVEEVDLDALELMGVSDLTAMGIDEAASSRIIAHFHP